jgi:hypothetical protein
VNASASALTREGEVQSEIGKIRTFSRYARVACSAVFGFGMVGCVGLLLFSGLRLIVPMPKMEMPDYLSTPQLAVWTLLVVGLVAGTWLMAVYQLYRLFGNLAAGIIYTSENVRRVRNVGLLWLLLAVLSIVIPAATAVFVRLGYFGAMVPSERALAFPLSSEWLSSFVTAGLVLLVSWIMDVGLYEKDHAEALQRDADLVI